MSVSVIDTWLDTAPGLFFSGYLLIGFVIGLIALKWPGARYESPIGTWVFIMFGWFPLAVVFVPIAVVWLIFGGLIKLFGIEAFESDTHGV